MAGRISNPTRRRLVALLASERLDGGRLIERLRQLRRIEGEATCAAMVHLVTHLAMPEDEAEQLLIDLDDHRRQIRTTLGRDPGLRVAGLDYLSNVRGMLQNPAIVELDELESTERSAMTDSLTGLYNRRYFDGALDIETRRSQRYGLGVCLLLLDLDRFKPINDLHGHRFGDLVLETIGRLLRRAVRDADVACRFGGDEFAVILPEAGRLGAFSLADRVRRAVESTFEQPFERHRLELSISGGVASFPIDGEDAEALIERADQALYLAKTQGRNRIVLHHAERRHYVRFPAQMRSRVLLRARGGTAVVEAQPINLSREGTLLSVDDDAPTEGLVDVTFRSADGEWVLPAEVIRSDRQRLALRFADPIPGECLEGFVLRASPEEESS